MAGKKRAPTRKSRAPRGLRPPDFRALFQSIPGLYLVLLPDFTIAAVSDSYLRATMTTRQGILGRGLFDVFPDNPDDPGATGTSNLRASLSRVLRKKAPDAMAVQKYDIRRPASEGGGFEERHWRPLNSPVLGPKGRIAYIIHQVEDVTDFVGLERQGKEREAAAAARARDMQGRLDEQGTLLSAVLNSAGEGVIAADREGKFIIWNPAAERLVGLGAAPAPQDQWSSHHGGYQSDMTTPYPPDQLPLARALRGESVDDDVHFSRNAAHPEGVWLSVTGRPLTDAEGRSLGGVVVFRDITARRRAEENIRRLNKDLEGRAAELSEANRELESFSYSVSHDLRAPLRSIDGFSQAVLEDEGDRLSAESRQNLHKVRAATQRMGMLIDDMLTLSRVTRKELVFGQVDMTALAADILDELRRADDARAVEAVIAPGMAVRGDAILLRAALTNLIGNAWKFTGKTGAARIEIGTEKGGSETVFFVRDNGAGFDMAYAAKLFGVFQRLHAATDFPGTGIGLATVQRIIQRHGGRVWAEGKPGEGAVFRFVIPESSS